MKRSQRCQILFENAKNGQNCIRLITNLVTLTPRGVAHLASAPRPAQTAKIHDVMAHQDIKDEFYVIHFTRNMFFDFFFVCLSSQGSINRQTWVRHGNARSQSGFHCDFFCWTGSRIAFLFFCRNGNRNGSTTPSMGL